MPTLPTRDNISYAVPSPARAASHAPDLNDRGRGIAAVGSVITGIADNEIRKDDAIKLIQAEAVHRAGLADIENSLMSDPDHRSYDRKFQEMSGALNEQTASMVNPSTRAQWSAKADMESQGVRRKILGHGRKMMHQEQVTNLDESLGKHFDTFSAPESSNDRRQESLKAINDSIELARKSGIIDPLHAQKMKSKYGQAADETLVRSRIGRDDVTDILKDINGHAGEDRQSSSERIMSMSARLETGTENTAKGLSNISKDAKGTRSYGNIGLNSGGSAQNFVSEHGDKFGFTAVPGTKEFDDQWKKAAADNPKELHAAELEWYDKNILSKVSTDLENVGVSKELASDPRVQAYFADRSVQYGGGSTNKHANRIADSFTQSAGDAEAFLKGVSEADRAALKQDFPSAIASGVYGPKGHEARVSGRESMALGMESTGYGGPYKNLTPHQRSTLTNVVKTAYRERSLQELRDSESMLTDTGKAPVDEKGRTALDRAKNVLTDNEYTKAQLKWYTAQATHDALAPLSEMTESEALDHVDKLHPDYNKYGDIKNTIGGITPNEHYGMADKIHGVAEKALNKMLKLRDEDPASAVASSKELDDAKKIIQNSGGKITGAAAGEAIVEARFAAQKRLGINMPEPITQREAHALLRISKGASEEEIDGAVRDAIRRSRDNYGKYADVAIDKAIDMQLRGTSAKTSREAAHDFVSILRAEEEKAKAPPKESWFSSLFGGGSSPRKGAGQPSTPSPVKPTKSDASSPTKESQTPSSGQSSWDGLSAQVKQSVIDWVNEDVASRSTAIDQRFGAGTYAKILATQGAK
jgi:hypothetical protein